jgi:hypothetical protein
MKEEIKNDLTIKYAYGLGDRQVIAETTYPNVTWEEASVILGEYSEDEVHSFLWE